MKFTITTGGHAGDILCMMSAAHTFARLTGHEVYLEQFKDVVECYDDGLLKHGKQGISISLDVGCYHRLKTGEEFKNYLGTFLKPLLPNLPLPTDFEFPAFAPLPRRCLIQPFSRTAANPSLEHVQAIVDCFSEETGEQLFAIGHPATERNLVGVDYSLLKEGIPDLMANISSAACVLTPRSASAHISAGYRVPTFLWLPDDGENWHLDYRCWSSVKCLFRDGISAARERMVEFCKPVRFQKYLTE